MVRNIQINTTAPTIIENHPLYIVSFPIITHTTAATNPTIKATVKVATNPPVRTNNKLPLIAH